MNITITAKDERISQSTKDYALEKAEKLEKFYRLRKMNIIMEIEGENYNIEEVATPEKSGTTIQATSQGTDWLKAIDQANEKMESQLRKIKGKAKSRRLKAQRAEKGKEETAPLEPPKGKKRRTKREKRRKNYR